jgi:hypothetical protein
MVFWWLFALSMMGNFHGSMIYEAVTVVIVVVF